MFCKHYVKKMTHKEYVKILMDIRNGKADDEEKLEQLDKVYKIKPVSILWNDVKAEIISKNKERISEAYNLLVPFICTECTAEGNVEGIEILKHLDEMLSDVTMAKYREYEIAQCKNEPMFLEKRFEQEKAAETAFLKDESSDNLVDAYLADCKIVSCYIVDRYYLYSHQKQALCRPWVEDIPNMGFLKETIDRKKEFILCVSKEKEQTELYILGMLLARMGCKVSIIVLPVQIEVEEPVEIQATVVVSMDNMTVKNNIEFIPAVELICGGKSLGNNVAEIVSALTGEGNKLCVLLAASCYIEELAATDVLRNNLQNLNIQSSEWKKENISFAWAGSYLEYIGEIYGMNVETAIHKISQCRFSIVIPARNSGTTLRYTLKTCLNQRYKGNYEIIISDNSSDGNVEVYNLVQEMKDEHIKYFRTPRELHLPKSFEYAFLQASGEYILPIGSDDALLPWTLEVLDEVVNNYPDEKIVYWERGFYAWPGFNGGQENQFVIPRQYQKGEYKERYISTISFLTSALKNPSHMYAMPLLYINSMFKRSYFDTLLVHTGRLWDGICQDLYMGVVTSLIMPQILCLEYPLSIAGMSSGSVGAISNTAIAEVNSGIEVHRAACVTGNIGGFAMSQTEMLFPEVTTDVSSFYNCFLKAVARGLLPENILWDKDGIDWKAWFLNCYHTLSKQDVCFCLKIQQLRCAAMKHGEDFLKWFEETIYREAMMPVIFGENKNTGRTYQEKEGESIILDASKRDVHNVFEASLLFEKLTGL